MDALRPWQLWVNKSHAGRLAGAAEDPQLPDTIVAARRVFCVVPENETADAVACGNDPSASSVETWESEG